MYFCLSCLGYIYNIIKNKGKLLTPLVASQDWTGSVSGEEVVFM